MGAIQVSDKIIINSKVRKYEVCFVNNIYKELYKYNKPNNFFLIDNYIYNNYFLKKNISITKNSIIIRPSEKNKEYNSISKILNKLIKKKINKNSILIVIGGGITQDIGGFISSILFRGIDWVFVPTTLLAQGDSCIGSKTSINFDNLKNQIGTYNPPTKVFIFMNFLKTLKKKELLSGLGEMSHYFILDSLQSYNLFNNEILKKNINFKKLINNSLKIKKKYIEIDEFEKSLRKKLNYGHSFGHAIESVSKYKIPHGVAVAKGIDIINYISFKMGYMTSNYRNKIRKTLLNIYCKYDFNKFNAINIYNAIKKDKKSDQSSIDFILLKKPGVNKIKNIKFNSHLKNIFLDYMKYEND